MQRQPASALDLFTDSVRSMGDAVIISVIEFDRHLDADRLRLAARRCMDAYPILSARLVRGNGPAYWERADGAADVVFSVVDIGNADYRPYAAHEVDPYKVPQVIFRILRSPERDIVVINLAHAAADGFGMKALAITLMQAYLDPDSVLPSDGILPPRDTTWTEELLDEEWMGPQEGVGLINPMWPRRCAASSAPASFHRAIISAEGLESIKRLAKEHSGTVNDVLLASYFLTMSELTGHYGPQNLFIPVNLRRHLTDGSRVMSNQSANVSFIVTRQPGEGMGPLLDKVVAETSRMKGEDLGIKGQVAFDRGCDPEGRAVARMVEDMCKMQDDGWADIFISNPGPMSLPDVDGMVDAYICYPGVYMPATCFVISTFRGRMTITMGYQMERESRDLTWKMISTFVSSFPIGPDDVKID